MVLSAVPHKTGVGTRTKGGSVQIAVSAKASIQSTLAPGFACNAICTGKSGFASFAPPSAPPARPGRSAPPPVARQAACNPACKGRTPPGPHHATPAHPLLRQHHRPGWSTQTRQGADPTGKSRAGHGRSRGNRSWPAADCHHRAPMPRLRAHGRVPSAARIRTPPPLREPAPRQFTRVQVPPSRQNPSTQPDTASESPVSSSLPL